MAGFPQHARTTNECGRGLLLVEALASRWGVDERKGPGKTVWAEYAVQRKVVRGPESESTLGTGLNGLLG